MMYCSSCGSAVAQSLSYCNRCGAKVSGAKGDAVTGPTEVKPESLVASMVALFIFGLGAIAMLMGAMKVLVGFDRSIILAVTIFSLMLLLVVEGVLIRLLLSGRRGVKGVGDIERQKEQTTRELGESQARALPEPLPSVTEHTTRSIEHVYGERNVK